MSDSRYKVTTKMDIPDLGDEESLLSLYNTSNPDIQYFNLIDQENIKLSGSLVQYFKYYASESYDKVYLEERNKVISKDSIMVWGSYDPKVIEENMSEFGLELTSDQVFVFNKSYIDNKLGRSPIPGDVIKPKFQNIKYQIHEVQEDSFEGYGVYHYNCFAKVLRESEDVVDEIITDVPPRVGGLSVFDEEDE